MKGPIRVLHILHTMNRGGAENALMNYYREMDRTKVQFDFLLTDPHHSSFEDEIIRLGGMVYRVPPLVIKNPFPYLKGVKRFFQEHPEYKIIHSHTSSKSVFPLWIAKTVGIPIRISHSHNALSEGGIMGMIRNALMPFLKLTANVYMSCGEQAAEWLYGKKYLNSGKVEIVHNVINAGLYRYNEKRRKQMRQELDISEEMSVVGHVARFSTQKNHLFALDIFNEFLKIHPNAIYMLVGDGENRSKILNKISELGISTKVKLIGVVSNVYDYEQAMDIFVLPSLCEGLPLSIIETQVSGLPCITTEGTVSSECSVTDLVKDVSLSLSPSEWAKVYLESTFIKRKDRYNEISAAGYDSKTTAHTLQERYIELYNSI